MGNFLECSFTDKVLFLEMMIFYKLSFLQPMIEFLSCIHIHSEGEDLNEISKTKSIRMVPTLCGMSSTDKCDSNVLIFFLLQKITLSERDGKSNLVSLTIFGLVGGLTRLCQGGGSKDRA